MAEMCTFGENNCKADFYCPISKGSDPSPAECQACSATMDKKFNCNCVDKSANEHCQECTNGECSKCLSTFFLEAKKCSRCDSGCSTCSSFKTCLECLPGHKLKGEVCYLICNKLGDCQGGTYCDYSTNECKVCPAECLNCISATFCGFCRDGEQYVDITGKCHAKCKDLKDNEYCKDGVTVACGPGINSPCMCGIKQNCASCTEDAANCATCLPGFKLDSGSCDRCLEGFLPVGGLCISNGSSSIGENKLSGGAIAGIVIGCLVVVGGVAGGLAYYFIKKSRK